jgi:hypothetical protein
MLRVSWCEPSPLKGELLPTAIHMPQGACIANHHTREESPAPSQSQTTAESLHTASRPQVSLTLLPWPQDLSWAAEATTGFVQMNLFTSPHTEVGFGKGGLARGF